MNIESTQVDPSAIASMQQDYWTTLTGPQDAYWQDGLIAGSDHFELRAGGQCVGYFVLDAENRMMQFHVVNQERRDAPELFEKVLEKHGVETAFAATLEPFYFNLCLDLQKQAKAHTYLFSDHHRVEPTLEGHKNHIFRPATHDDLPRILPLLTGGDEFIDLDTVETHFAGPLGYAKMVIDAGILNVLEVGKELLGTGELRQREQWPPFADVGMIVNKKYRRQGIGTYLLTILKQKAYQQGLKPICSCETGNVGSRKAVENAGFIPYHRVVELSF